LERKVIMQNGMKIVLCLLILFVTVCREGDQVDRNRSNQEFASTYLGGNGNEFCEAIALDDDGNIYVAGYTRASDFPTTEGAYNRNPKGKSDVFIAKFDNELKTLLASTLIGGDEDECAYTMLFDPRGHVYVAGYTSSKNFPTTAQAYVEDYNGGDGDAFILKMDKDLKTLVSSTYLGGSGVEDDWRSPEMVQDGDGNIYIAGITGSDDFPTTHGVFQVKYNGGTRDVFLSKFDSDLRELLASTLLGGSGDDRMGRSLCIDPKKNEICVGGYTYSPDFPTSQDAYGREVTGHLDGFVSKFSMDLNTMTASTILKAGWIYCMMIHENGDIYVGGHAAENLPTTSNAFHQTFDKASDQGFISCLSNDLSNLKSSTVIPGSYATGGGRICSLNLYPSSDGHILSAGWVRPIDFPITPGVYDETQNGNSDTYIMKMDKDLSEVLLSTFIGGSRSERWNRMTVDGTGNIYLASYTLSSDFPTTESAAYKTFSEVIDDEEEDLGKSPNDAFVIKIDGNLSAEEFEELHEDAKRDRADKLQKLVSVNKDLIEKRDKYQRTPLHSAARYGALSAAKFLLDQGADVNVKDEKGNTPLHLASVFGHDEIVDLLIHQKADVDVLNDQRETPLILASLYGNPECIKLLVASRANISLRDSDGNSPIQIAVTYRHPENLEEILKGNPDIDEPNTEGFTPLHLAVQRPGNQKAVELLLRQGADINITDPEGRNALLVSVGSHQKDYIELLVSNGIDIDSQDNDGNTALHYPLLNILKNKLYLPHGKEIVKVLTEEGADPRIRNKEGKSPMDLAVESGEDELMKLLIDNEKEHYSHPWKVHEIAKDFELLDVWEFPILADKTRNQNFSLFLKIMQQRPQMSISGFFLFRQLVARFLVSLRVYMGEIFGLDKNINSLPIPGCKETSLKERLSVEDQKRSLAETIDDAEPSQGIWRTVYRYENEMLTELSNDTVHALMHFGWVHKSGNYFTAQLAVYAKPRGNLGDFYMKLIMPFRHVIVYPTMLEEVKKRWEAYNKIRRQQSIEEWEKKTFIKQPPEKVMDAAGVKQGMIIGEVGAGRGRFTMHLARRVGPKGKIFANDIDADALAYLKERCKHANITNVNTILGEEIDPLFPKKSLDMIFMVWVYHYVEQPLPLLKNLPQSLRPGGTVVLVEPKPGLVYEGQDHGISPERMRRDAAEAGFDLIRIEDFLSEDLIFVLKIRD
jgi:ankyrin repeat protein/SAM-dependent methyltransferase